MASDEGRARLERYTQDVSCLYRDDEGEWVRYEDAQQAIAAARAEGEAAGREAEATRLENLAEQLAAAIRARAAGGGQ
jgi:hypothetical protein